MTRAEDPENVFKRLSRRQRECLRLVPQTSKEIAAQLGLEWRTVDTYLSEALKRLGVSDRRTAARMLAEYESGIPQRLRYEPDAVEPAPNPPMMAPPREETGVLEPNLANTVREERAIFDPSVPPPSPSLLQLFRHWLEGYRSELSPAERTRTIIRFALAFGIGLLVIIAVGESLQRTLKGLGY